ncbi:MAG: hypothetical protein SFW67_32945 [Myxococcaceae bacterium]|nr:hypothetical protein [Myxococcaceae bacterium]
MWRLAVVSSLVASIAFAQDGMEPPAEPAAPPPPGPDLRDFGHARTLAMGGAYMSLGYGVETIGGNPAALSAFKRYQMEASGAWDIPNGMGFATVGLADSTGPLAMGLSYHFATFGGLERRWGHITTVALSYAIADWIHLAVAGRHHVLIGASNTNSVTMNAGLVIKPVPFISIGVSGHNLINNFNRDITRFFVASVSAMFFNQLSPCFDLRADFNGPQARFAYHGGLEWLIAMTVPVRLGYQYDGIMNHHYVSGGVGWFVQGSGIDLAYRHELGGAEGRMLALTVKLQLGQ